MNGVGLWDMPQVLLFLILGFLALYKFDFNFNIYPWTWPTIRMYF